MGFCEWFLSVTRIMAVSFHGLGMGWWHNDFILPKPSSERKKTGIFQKWRIFSFMRNVIVNDIVGSHNHDSMQTLHKLFAVLLICVSLRCARHTDQILHYFSPFVRFCGQLALYAVSIGHMIGVGSDPVLMFAALGKFTNPSSQCLRKHTQTLTHTQQLQQNQWIS